jgi:hypothetical protein
MAAISKDAILPKDEIDQSSSEPGVRFKKMKEVPEGQKKIYFEFRLPTLHFMRMNKNYCVLGIALMEKGKMKDFFGINGWSLYDK